MANDFAGLVVKPGQSTDILKPVDTTPEPPKPKTPQPPQGWDKMSYKAARNARKYDR